MELSRLGSMRAVADLTQTRVSTVSGQIATLAREVGVPLVEPDGRGVRLTPAGRRLVDHAVIILAAVEAARADLDPQASPAGVVRISGYASALNRVVFPLMRSLAQSNPDVRLAVHEREPEEALRALLANDVDVALIYDHNLAPIKADPTVEALPLWDTNWNLAVPADAERERSEGEVGEKLEASPSVFARYQDHTWISNPRNSNEETVLRVLGSMAGFEPQIYHRVDSLDLVEDLVRGGDVVGLVPADRPVGPGVSVIPLVDPAVTMRIFALTKKGQSAWPPLALVLDELREGKNWF